MNILAIGAHPDDIEYGCGGTLLKYSRNGDSVYLAVLTGGEVGGELVTRKKEQEEAAKLLKAKKIFWGGFKDTALPVNKKIISYLDEVIFLVKPYEVYINYLDNTHQDHRTLAYCGISATRYVKRVLFYEDYTSCNFEPDVFVDIADVLDEKVALLKAHLSQIARAYPTGLDILESVRAVANFRGFQAKVKYAEGFKALRFLKDVESRE